MVADVGPDSGRLNLTDHAVSIRDLLTHTAGIPDPEPTAIHEDRRYLSAVSVHPMTEAHTTGIHPVGWMRGAD